MTISHQESPAAVKLDVEEGLNKKKPLQDSAEHPATLHPMMKREGEEEEALVFVYLLRCRQGTLTNPLSQRCPDQRSGNSLISWNISPSYAKQRRQKKRSLRGNTRGSSPYSPQQRTTRTGGRLLNTDTSYCILAYSPNGNRNHILNWSPTPSGPHCPRNWTIAPSTTTTADTPASAVTSTVKPDTRNTAFSVSS